MRIAGDHRATHSGFAPAGAEPIFISRFRRSYFLAIRCGFFSLDCRRFAGFRLGLLITNVPLP
jgi:hypothetical protein